MKRPRMYLMCVLAMGAAARSATAVPPPPATSLNSCQNAVKVATATFMKSTVAAIGGCLQAISTQRVKNNKPDASLAAATCVAQFRKLNDSRGLNKQLSDKLAAAITKKCAPGQPGVSHTLADIIGSGAGVPQPLNVKNLNVWCGAYGGDGSIDTLQEWIGCVTTAAECDVDSAIASQYPRAIEWLNLVKPSMQVLAPPLTDPNKVSDAVAGLAAVKAELDGPDNDNTVSIQCGGGGATCGNGNIDGGESCDQGNLNGATCVTRGFAGGTLSCAANCLFDTAGCWAAPRFTDNANGTITDKQTGLMWEKKVEQDGTMEFTNLQDADNSYKWAGICTLNGSKYCQPTTAAAAACAAAVDGDASGCDECGGGDGTCNAPTTVWTWLVELNAGSFATHNNWRLPKRAELEGLIDATDATPPVVDVAFDGASCGGGCTDVTSAACSCTPAGDYWSSSVIAVDPTTAWLVFFGFGSVGAGGTNFPAYVRAVRDAS
jgi:hypothetical protein